MKPKQQRNNNNNRELLRYAGLGTQIFVALGLAVFIGLKADKWLKFSRPLLVWLLPLLTLFGIFYSVYKQTSKRDKNNE
jgi:hypothetical protein